LPFHSPFSIGHLPPGDVSLSSTGVITSVGGRWAVGMPTQVVDGNGQWRMANGDGNGQIAQMAE
jgi:hypothetical protein